MDGEENIHVDDEQPEESAPESEQPERVEQAAAAAPATEGQPAYDDSSLKKWFIIHTYSGF